MTKIKSNSAKTEEGNEKRSQNTLDIIVKQVWHKKRILNTKHNL